MIVADRKPLEEIQEMIKDCDNILLVGCKGCVTVCNVGGLKEVQILASILRIARKKDGRPLKVEERVLERQCDPEYIEQLRDTYDKYDAVLSMACGVGPQFLSEAYPGQRFFPHREYQVFRWRGPARHLGRALCRLWHLCYSLF